MNPTPHLIAGRLRRPRWSDPRLLIGVALIAVAVIGTGAVVARADRTDPYFAARHTLTPGTVVAESDLVVAHVRVGSGTYVSTDDAPWGQVVTRVIGAGELLPEGSLVDAEGYSSRPVAIATARPLAEAIEPGAVVDVWVTSEGPMGPRSTLVAQGVVVDEVDRDTGAFVAGSGETVYVLVPAMEVGELLAALAEADEVSVVGIGRSSA